MGLPGGFLSKKGVRELVLVFVSPGGGFSLAGEQGTTALELLIFVAIAPGAGLEEFCVGACAIPAAGAGKD